MSCILPYVLDMFQILLSGNSLRDLWNVCMYVLSQGDDCGYMCEQIR